MSRCRATSFYLAPGIQRYFRDHTLVAVLSDGRWVELSHRNDVKALKARHPGWDGTVFCGPSGGVERLRAMFLDEPARLERWNLDARVVEGRRPAGPSFPLWRLYTAGAESVGGSRQVVQALFPAGSRTLRQAVSSMVERQPRGLAFRLSLAVSFGGVLSDDELAELLDAPSIHDVCRWAPVNPVVFRNDFLQATVGLSPAARRRCAVALLSGSDRGAYERQLAAGMAEDPRLLSLLSHDRDETIVETVLANPATPADVLVRFVSHPSPLFRMDVARNPSTPLDALWILADDADPSVQAEVAENRLCPVELLEYLADRGDGFVHGVVACQSLTPPHLLRRFAMDPSSATRASVARNTATPPQLLSQLVLDSDEYVAVGAFRNSSTPFSSLEPFLSSGEEWQLMAVASHPDVTPEALGLLSRHENPRVRSNVASRPDLSAELVRHLASDESRLVRLTIFNREGLPSAVREQLKADPDPLLQAELKERAELFALRQPESRWFVGADLDDAVFSTDHMFVNHPLVREVHGVAMMVGHPHPAADRADLARVDSVRDLPGFGAIPYVSASAFADQVDGSTVTVAACDVKIGVSAQPVELVARVLRSEQLVRANAEYMGNCTETYAHFIAAGVTQVVAFDDPRTGRCVLNVELVRDGDAAWSVGQVNTRFNGFGSDGSAVPSGVSEAVVRFVDLVNARQSV